MRVSLERFGHRYGLALDTMFNGIRLQAENGPSQRICNVSSRTAVDFPTAMTIVMPQFSWISVSANNGYVLGVP
jgi:hypothetical protein